VPLKRLGLQEDLIHAPRVRVDVLLTQGLIAR
jgi:hypothetical protein